MTTRARSVTAEQLVDALKRRGTALPSEIGRFIVLEVCASLIDHGPGVVTLSAIQIGEDGSIVVGRIPPSGDEAAARALHRVLAALLVMSGPALPESTLRLVEHGPARGVWTLAALHDELEASLVPLNRNASRRVLARFLRETSWAPREPARAVEDVRFRQLDSELSALLGEPQPARPPVSPARSAFGLEDATTPGHAPGAAGPQAGRGEEEVAFFDSIQPPSGRESTAKTVVDPVPSARANPPRSRAGGPPPGLDATLREEPALDSPRSSRGWLLGLLLIVLSAVLVGAVWWLRPELVERAQQPLPDSGAGGVLVVENSPPAGDLVVRVDEPRAQVLRLVGRGPVTVEHLPLGVAHEFVAVAEGLSPTRVLVPKDAQWESGPDGPQYEIAMQLGRDARRGELALGESLLPQDVGRPQGALGSIRIVTTPRGAKVYQLVGFAPEARIENVPRDASQELLVYKEGYEPEKRVVSPADFADQAGRTVAEIRVALSPKADKGGR